MPRLFQPLLLLIAGFTDRQLASTVQFLKTENDILRSKLPKRLTITSRERTRLLKFGKPLGSAIKHVISIVKPATFRKWVRDDSVPAAEKKPRRKPGRPRTPIDIRSLILRIARETGKGLTSIMGELRKLRVRFPSRSTVKNILKEAGIDPGPKRGEKTWNEFIRIHAATLWQCDFFAKKILTLRGWKDAFVLVFLHVGSRRVFVTPATRHPDTEWVLQQGQAFLEHLAAKGHDPRKQMLFHDRDSKYAAAFNEKLVGAGIDVQLTPFRSPNLQAYVERWIQSIKMECLDHFIAIGEDHLNHLVREFVAHHHLERPHQGRDNLTLDDADLPAPPPILPFPERVECRERLGGVLKHYRRAA